MATTLRFLLGCLLLFFILIQSATASHMLGGQLTYQSDTTANPNPLRYFFKLITFQDRNSGADEPTATLYLGDGISISSARTSRITLSNSCNAIYQSTYFFEYTFSGPGQYTAVYHSPNRTKNIVNLTNSDLQTFIIKAQFTIDPFDATNRSQRFLTGMIPCAAQNQTFRHSLATFDLDGDSLEYELIPPLSGALDDNGIGLIENVKGYTLPRQVSINAKTGEFIWDKPAQLGAYSFAVRVNEYRNKLLVGTVMRDFVINVVPGPENFAHSFSIENRSELSITDDNQIFLTAGQPIKIKVKYQTTSPKKRLLTFSELFYGSSTNQIDTIATQDGVLAEITLNPEESWRRSQPYIFVLRGISEVNGTLVQQDFMITLIAKPELVSGVGEGPGEATLGKEAFIVYPNPTQGYFWVKNKHQLPRGQYKLYNALQQVVLKTKLNTELTRIILPPLATGIYIYQIIAENGQVRQSGKLHIE